MNGYILLANLVVALHLAYVAFVVVMVPVIVIGGILKWGWVRNFWFRLVHFLMMAVVVFETALGMTCPVTTWESELRVAGGQMVRVEGGYSVTADQQQIYQEDFVGRLLRRILFFDTEEVPKSVLNALYYAFGAMILISLLLVPPRLPRRRAAPSSPGVPAQRAPAAA